MGITSPDSDSYKPIEDDPLPCERTTPSGNAQIFSLSLSASVFLWHSIAALQWGAEARNDSIPDKSLPEQLFTISRESLSEYPHPISDDLHFFLEIRRLLKHRILAQLPEEFT